ncbi:hypothetical protein [Sphingobium sp. C100]|uniref:hypothetical protein n=1 Tax=Sphingobium sp. C100 TaxID=1207055 RepID=UPI0012698347|nr:hypothetical protein [Sphingobium sp. C100]
MIDVLLVPLAKPAYRSTVGPAPVTTQLPQALVAAQRSGLAPAGASPAADRGDRGSARVGASAPRRSARLGRDGGLVMMIEAARYGLDLSGWNADWTGARHFLAGIVHERCASMGAL